MSDAMIRELEREYQQSGTVEAEAALLRARIRRGDSTGIRCLARTHDVNCCAGTLYVPLGVAIGAAGHCGHEAARLVAPARHPRTTREVSKQIHRQDVSVYRAWKGKHQDLQMWTSGLYRWPYHYMFAALGVASTKVLFEATGHQPRSVGRLLSAADRWLDEPTDGHMLLWDERWRDVVAEHVDWAPPVWLGHAWLLSAARVMIDDRPIRRAVEMTVIRLVMGTDG